MKKINLLIISVVLILSLVSGCTKKATDLNICGDGICTLTEDCNTCLEDCACGSNEYCNTAGICREAVCGDEICSEEEKLNALCCEDCGCEENNICNKVTQKCQDKIDVSENLIKNIVDTYLSENEIEGKIKKTVDTYYKEQIIKEVTIDCTKEELPYPCEIILFIDEKGEILKEIKTT